MDERMTHDFISCSTVFQLYQDDGRVMMNGCVQWNLVMVGKISTSSGVLNLGC